MKKLVILGIIIAVLVMSLIACKTAEGQADDIVPVPGGGPMYRANVQEQGVHNPWPPIEDKKVTIGISPDVAEIYYRDYIETEAGQTRNNLFSIYLPNAIPSNTTYIKTILQGVDLPSRITVTQDDWEWHGPDPAQRSKTALIIEISSQLATGEYPFDINVNIDGKDYGTIPCTIRIIE
jgi:hypothetical protein